MFSLKSEENLAGSKVKEDSLDVDKVKTVPANLSKLTKSVDNDDV